MKILALVLMFTPLLAYADYNNHFSYNDKYERGHKNELFWSDVKHRQHKQESRIERGIDRGQLTHREVKKLHREQKHVAKQVRRYQQYHYMNRKNKRRIMGHLDFVGQQIRALKHNDRYARVVRTRHGKQIQKKYLRHQNSRDVSWENNHASAGFYFRF
ncbi:MAG: hypothetical protein GQ532_04145 [Methylomarinum sp.]|nr:hypothetical protein [Methylomarinum sp.]